MRTYAKFSLIIVLFGFVLLVTSCKKDDNPVSSDGNELVGTWKLTKVIVVSMGNIELAPEFIGMQATFEMKSDKTFKVTTVDSSGTEIQTGTWTIGNGKVSMKGTDGETVEMPYTLSGNTLTVQTKYTVDPYGEQDVKLVLTKQ